MSTHRTLANGWVVEVLDVPAEQKAEQEEALNRLGMLDWKNLEFPTEAACVKFVNEVIEQADSECRSDN